MSGADRVQLHETFNQAAELYDVRGRATRPGRFHQLARRG
jgi:hypothetical protein